MYIGALEENVSENDFVSNVKFSSVAVDLGAGHFDIDVHSISSVDDAYLH